MFRNPRENAQLPPEHKVAPSVGRPPSPPITPNTSRVDKAPSAMATSMVPAEALSKPAQTPSKPRQSTLIPSSWSKKSSTTGGAASGQLRDKAKQNGNILTFFKKAEAANNALFTIDHRAKTSVTPPPEEGGMTELVGWDTDSPENKRSIEDRFHEDGGSVKRPRLSPELRETSLTELGTERALTEELITPCIAGPTADNSTPRRKISGTRGPFLEVSDDEEEGTPNLIRRRVLPRVETGDEVEDTPVHDQPQYAGDEDSEPPHAHPPITRRESTSCAPDDAFADFEGMDFDEDLEGEEYDERVWIEEQRRMEMTEAGLLNEGEDDVEIVQQPVSGIVLARNQTSNDIKTVNCPICESSISELSDEEMLVHVNSCLDGNPIPLPKKIVMMTDSLPLRPDNPRRFQKLVRPPRSGQENPFKLGEDVQQKSAFSKLMSNHAEDIAWQTAAASEQASRGKPAYQRTCPFYKILPGLYICVDAFRYGAVKDCQAYFLSHFHSDHYIGLTSSWSHGPIYCSKVTANLVKQQLRVDPKYVVALDFEATVEVPGTRGVHVTMIPANHCPGSSLFLFEKALSHGKHPKKQRVLHCGDFRACQAHIEHPLLRPDTVDALGRKTGQQRIDVCYLDTTYLNPKYAFPNQDEVIKACAEMCVCLNKVQADESDGWETMKRERAGEGMVKFVQKGVEIKKESDADVDIPTQQASSGDSSRGRLLVIVGTYSIGKERMCMGIARALNSKIYAPPGKQRICAALEDPELNARLTSNPREAQVHMTPLFEIRAETLDDYLKDYKENFSRAVGFRPTGWNYRPPNSRFVESPSVQTVLHSTNWKSTYTMRELTPQRGSTSRASCFGVPYSEHSSFRELTMFCCALRIDKIIPTVNVGSAKSRERMKSWCDRWTMERKKNGLFRPGEGGSSW